MFNFLLFYLLDGEVNSRPSSTEPHNLDNNSSLRRACSLSDLNRPAVTKRLLPAPPGKENTYFCTIEFDPHFRNLVSGKKNSSGRYRPHPQQLQQPEVHSTSPEENVPSYMRSTSASAKKESSRPVQGSSNLLGPRRRTSFNQSQSQMDLRTAASSGIALGGGGGGSDEDTSSESENLQRSKNPRRRSSSHDRRPTSVSAASGSSNNGHMMIMPREVTQSERDLSKVTKVRVRTNANMNIGSSGSTKELSSSTNTPGKPRTKMKTTTMILTGGSSGGTAVAAAAAASGEDVVRAPLNWHLVDHTIDALQKSSDDLVQLYKRISLDYDMEEGERAKMLQKLAYVAGVSQQTLKPVNPTAVLPAETNKSPYVQHMMDNYSRPDKHQSNLQNQGPSWC